MPPPTLLGRTESVMPGLTIAEWRSWQNFLDAAFRVIDAQDRRMAEAHDLTLDDFRILHTLSLTPQRSARMGYLAETLASSPSRVTRQLSRLEARGLAERTRSVQDGRGVVAKITDEGCRLVGRAATTYSDGIRSDFLDPMSRAQVIAMSDYCRRLCGK
jgi:DNA-binding MarR family transcriptional regulator